jgi:hypothetical protein
MRKFIISLCTIVALGATSLVFAQGTALDANGIGKDCAKVRGAATVEGPQGQVLTGPGWLEIKGRRYDGLFKVLAIPDATPDVDPQTGAIRLSSFGFESYIFDGGTMYARDVALWRGNVLMPGQFDIFGATLSGPAFDQSPDYPTWGTGVFAKALLSLRFRGTIVIDAAGAVRGTYTVEDGSICNVDWKAIK